MSLCSRLWIPAFAGKSEIMSGLLGLPYFTLRGLARIARRASDRMRSSARRSTSRARRPRRFASTAGEVVSIRGGAGIFSKENAGTVIPSSLSRNTLENFHPEFFLKGELFQY
jgi:hypothetical protein